MDGQRINWAKRGRTKRYPEAIDKPRQQSESPTGPFFYSSAVGRQGVTSQQSQQTNGAHETKKEFLLLPMAMEAQPGGVSGVGILVSNHRLGALGGQLDFSWQVYLSHRTAAVLPCRRGA